MMYKCKKISLLPFCLFSTLFICASDTSGDESGGNDSGEETKRPSRRKSSNSSQKALAPVGGTAARLQRDIWASATSYLWRQTPGRKYRTIFEAEMAAGTLLETY